MPTAAIAPSTRELVLGRYRPMRPLGSGGSGSVWLARDERNGLDVALKIIPREGKAAARAEREALAGRRLRHERCVRSYDAGSDGSHVYIAYEYVPGRTLREAIRSDLLEDAEAVEVAAQVLDALAHAHRVGIVHRDVKPSNVLIEDRDEIAIRLLDFGLAQFDGADTLTAVGDVPGTLAYIAPERLAGEDATPESDVWSVGVLLWETLAGRHPFWGVPLQDVARAIHAGAPPLESERRRLPRRLLWAIDAALSLEPEDRPRASALAADLRRSVRSAPRPERRPESQDPSASEAPARVLARRLAPIALGVTTTAIGATILPFWPAVLVGALVAGAGVATSVRPRIGLAVALATPVFPLGNLSAAAAVVYGAFALAWLVFMWREARWGSLFVLGPLLAPFGLLALIPLAVQPVRSAYRRAALGALGVAAAVLTAGVAGEEMPLGGGPSVPLGTSPSDSVSETALAVWNLLAHEPRVLVGGLVLAGAAAALPTARRRTPYGLAALGLALTAASVAAGISAFAALVLAAVWGVPAAVQARAAR